MAASAGKARKAHYWQIGPAVLAAFAVAALIFPLFHPPTTLDFGPIRLKPGDRRTVSFKVGYDETYAIGLQMDQQIAKRLAPCLVDPDETLGFTRQFCERAMPSELPPAFLITLVGDGANLSSTVEPSMAIGGGEYEGKTYTWEAAYVHLRPGTKYDLTVRLTGDATILAPAKPKLVVMVSTPGFFEGLALKALGSHLLAALLLVVGASWALAGRTRSRKPSRAKERAAPAA